MAAGGSIAGSEYGDSSERGSRAETDAQLEMGSMQRSDSVPKKRGQRRHREPILSSGDNASPASSKDPMPILGSEPGAVARPASTNPPQSGRPLERRNSMSKHALFDVPLPLIEGEFASVLVPKTKRSWKWSPTSSEFKNHEVQVD